MSSSWCGICDCFWHMPLMDKAVFLSRLLWPVSFGLLWIGVIPHGWQTAQAGGLSGAYGLWGIKYMGGGAAYTAAYEQWSDAQSGLEPFNRVQGTRALVLLCIAAGGLHFLAALRAYCTRTVQIKKWYLALTAASAIATLAFTCLALAVWKSIPSDAFEVFCTSNGCSRRTGVTSTVGYSWGFFIIKALAELIAAPALCYLSCVAFGQPDGAASSLPTAPSASTKQAAPSAPAAAGTPQAPSSDASPSVWGFWRKEGAAPPADPFAPPAPTAPSASAPTQDFKNVGPSADGLPSWMNA